MEQLKSLLDRVYELEGLIHLALSRNDEASNRIADLISAKGNAVQKALEAYEKVSVKSSDDNRESDNPLEEVEELISYSLEEEETSESHESDENGSDDDSVYDESGETAPDDAESMNDSEEENQKTLAGIAESVEEEEEGLAYGPEDVYPEDSPKINNEEENDGEKESQKNVNRRLRTLFSINDRFRFSRELFGGSTRRFDDSLTYLDDAIDFNEVEDFFISDQGMDPESPVVQEFLEVLSRSFAD